MKIQLFILTILLSAILFSCNSTKKSDEVASYNYDEKEVKLNPEIQSRIGSWIEEGMVCYGLVVAIDDTGQKKYGKPVKAKVIKISNNDIKMKALEAVNITPSKKYAKMMISEGEYWLEDEGELFKTKEQAIDYLKANNWFMN